MSGGVFISVIIPVYNVSEYIRECLDSVVSQKTSREIEIILVDDGSTDGSSEICGEYAGKYDRVSVIHRKNGGAAAARNTGVRSASGEYILFIDADDFICGGSIDKIIRQTVSDGGCDVGFLNADIVLKDGRLKKWAYMYDKNSVYQKSGDKVLTYIAGTSRFPVSPAIKIISRKFILEKNICFTEGIVCEDVDYMIQLLIAAQTFNCYDFPYYRARAKREGSVMTSGEGAKKRFDSTLFIIEKWLDRVEERPEYQKNAILAMLAVQFMFLVAMYNDIPHCDKNIHIKDLSRLSWLLRHGNHAMFLPVRILIRLCGFKVSAAALSVLLL